MARVRLLVDNDKLQALDKNVDKAKLSLEGLQAAAQKKIAPDATGLSGQLTKLSQGFLALRDAAHDTEGGLKPEVAKRYADMLEEAQKEAEQLRRQLDRLRLVDPNNPNIKKLESQLNEVEREAKQTTDALTKMGAAARGADKATGALGGEMGGLGKIAGYVGGFFAVQQVVGWAQAQLAAADATGKLAAQLGMATDEMQAWEAFTSQAGATNEDLRGTLGAVTRAMESAAKGGKEARASFDAIGVSTDGWDKQLPNLSEGLLTIAGSISQVEDQSQRLKIAQQLLGETGVKLLPGFKAGTEAAREQLQTLKELAVVYSDDFIKQAEAANDEMDLFKRQLSGIGAEILIGALPALRGFVREVTPAVRGLREVAGNANLVKSAIGMLGISKLSGFITRLGGMGTLLRPVIRFLWRFVAPLLAIDDAITWLRGGKSVFGDLLDGMLGLGASEEVLKNVHAMWDGISGSIQTAWGHLKGDQAAIDEGQAKLEQHKAWLKGFTDDLDYMFNDLLGASTWKWVKENHEAYSQVEKDNAESLAKMAKAAWEWLEEFGAVQSERRKIREAEQNAEKRAAGEALKGWSSAALRRLGELAVKFKAWGDDVRTWFAEMWDDMLGGLGRFIDGAGEKIDKLKDFFGIGDDDEGESKSGDSGGRKPPAPPPPLLNPERYNQISETLGRYASPSAAPVGSSTSSSSFLLNDERQINITVQGGSGSPGAIAERTGKAVGAELTRDRRMTFKNLQPAR